jgi:hypothetical protein
MRWISDSVITSRSHEGRPQIRGFTLTEEGGSSWDDGFGNRSAQSLEDEPYEIIHWMKASKEKENDSGELE